MKGRTFFREICLLMSVTLCVSSAIADPKTRTLRRGFSQLEFDKGAKIPPKTVADKQTLTLEAIKNDPTLLINYDGQIIEAHGSQGATAEKVVTEVNDSPQSTNNSPLEVTAYLLPSLRGVQSDNGNSSTITSTIGWLERKGSGCVQALNTQQLCNKAKALREVASKFSGNNDFYDSQCPASCATERDKNRLVSFEINDETQAALRFEASGNQCLFALKKPPHSKDWMTILVGKVNCACLPTNCM